MTRLRIAACFAWLSFLSWGGPAQAQPGASVVIEIEPSAVDLDATALRAAAAQELDARVLAPEDPGAGESSTRIAVGIDREHGELTVTQRGSNGGVERRVALPRDPVEARRAAVFLIGNIVRDQASDVIAGLGPRRESVTPAPPVEDTPPAAPVPMRPARRRWWAGLTVEGDALALSSASDVCATPNLYACDIVAPGPVGGSATIVRGEGDQIAGGLAPGAVRVTLSLDYALDDNLLVGARLGLAIRDDGFHAEARGTYVLGDRPLARSGLAPVFSLGAGLAQYSASVPVTVWYQGAQGQSPTTSQARRMERPYFASAGAGLRFAPSANVAIVAYPLRGVLAAGAQSPLFVLAPELGVELGF